MHEGTGVDGSHRPAPAPNSTAAEAGAQMRQPVALAHACRLINHGPTVLVSAAHDGRRNVMAAAWSMPVEFAPPRIAVVIDKSTYTRGLVLGSGAFALSLPCRGLADLTYTVGSVSAREEDPGGPDKFARYGIEAFAGPVLGLPLLAGCVAWLECRLLPEPHAQEAYDTFFGEVVSAQADDRVFADGHWSFRDDNADLHTLHHLGGGSFAVPTTTVRGRVLR
jgi:flavin reductase (DIM6/NTAB) family NADH-FMN oxidoreductase RutF